MRAEQGAAGICGSYRVQAIGTAAEVNETTGEFASGLGGGALGMCQSRGSSGHGDGGERRAATTEGRCVGRVVTMPSAQ